MRVHGPAWQGQAEETISAQRRGRVAPQESAHPAKSQAVEMPGCTRLVCRVSTNGSELDVRAEVSQLPSLHGSGGWGGEAGRCSWAVPVVKPQCREAPQPRTHLQCRWQLCTLSSCGPGPGAYEASNWQLPFPSWGGAGLWGGAQRWGSQDPRRPQLFQHGSHPPFLFGWVVAPAWAPRGTASLGDSTSTHLRHVLSPSRTCSSPGRRAGA